MKKTYLLISTVILITISCKTETSPTIGISESNKQEVFVPDTLRIYTGLSAELLSMTHNIDGFFIPATKNEFPNSDKNVNEIKDNSLDGLLSLTALAYINGEVAGLANETELIYDFSNQSDANTMWLLRMNKSGCKGFITAEQVENPKNADPILEKAYQKEMAKKVKVNQDFLFRTTSKEGATVAHASGDFEKYNGGKFTEYSILNPSKPGEVRILLEFISVPKNN